MRRALSSINIIVSVYNEEEGLYDFWIQLNKTLCDLSTINAQVIWVNDGSKDKSQQVIEKILCEEKKENIGHCSIEFSRNYGHEAAMIAGIDHAEHEAIICLDADLQHPSAKIPEMINAYEQGSEIVLMKRTKREDNGPIKNLFSNLFYFLFYKLTDGAFSKNSSDFFLISQKIASILKTNFRERNRFIRGYIQIVGFEKQTLSFEAPSRLKGESSYSFKSLFQLAFNAFFVFSNKLLSISLYVSLLFLLFSILIIIYSLYEYFFGDSVPSGYTTLIVFNSICFTTLFFLVAILSIYFGKTFDEIKDRPIYLIKNFKKK